MGAPLRVDVAFHAPGGRHGHRLGPVRPPVAVFVHLAPHHLAVLVQVLPDVGCAAQTAAHLDPDQGSRGGVALPAIDHAVGVGVDLGHGGPPLCIEQPDHVGAAVPVPVLQDALEPAVGAVERLEGAFLQEEHPGGRRLFGTTSHEQEEQGQPKGLRRPLTPPYAGSTLHRLTTIDVFSALSSPTGAISDALTLRAARRLRTLSWLLEGILAAIVVGSVAALGSVHPWAYRPLWGASVLAVVLLAARATAVRALRRRLGPRVFSFHSSERWLVLGARSERDAPGWTFDLARPIVPRGPLIVPGLAFLGLALFQTVPLPPWLADLLQPARPTPLLDPGQWRPLTISPTDTARGLAFLGSALLLHTVAGAILDQRDARARFRRVLAVLGLALSLFALAQLASGTKRLYGVVAPLEGGGEAIFGPFVNRNHFATYMLLLIPLALGHLTDAYRRYARRIGDSPNLRRRLLALASPEGAILLYASVPVVATTGALLATTSRGGLAAFVGALLLAALTARREGGAPVWALALTCVAMPAAWFGLERVEARLVHTKRDAPARAVVWKDSLQQMPGRWLVGSGFNTYGVALGRVSAWSLPAGATPWPGAAAKPLVLGSRIGYRSPAELPGNTWYREAHNDYVQTLVETGIPGLVLALWAALALVAGARRDPWLLAAIVGVLLHEGVDFGLQIPAVAVLFVVVAAMRPRER